jgi:pimeloyl-ACP methyl ester carboxylesterase
VRRPPEARRADSGPELGTRTFAVRAGRHTLQVMTLAPAGAVPGQPTLVLLHEGLGSIAQWRDFPQQLSMATGLAALVYDRVGHGGSDPLSAVRGAHYLHQEAEESLPALLEACGITVPLLVGHSDGGTIALLYAANFPERPGGVVTEAAHVFVEEVTLTGIRAAVEAYESGDLRGRLARHHGERTGPMFRGWSDTWLSPGFRHWNIEAALPHIRCPILAIQGEDDEYATPAQVHAIVARVSGRAEALLLPGCGHTPHHQARERVLREIARFVGKKVRGQRMGG